MNYHSFKTQDFVLDKKFREWIYQPNKDLNLFWDDFLKNNPHKVKQMEEAKYILLSIYDFEYIIPDSKAKEIWQNIQTKAYDENEIFTLQDKIKVFHLNSQSVLSKYKNSKAKFKFNLLKIAAAFIFLIISSGVVYFLNNSINQQLVEIDEPNLIVKSNPWGQRSTIYLSDGSEVQLNSGSSIKFQENFNNQERKVFLEGEAFFLVAKDSKRPFRVYSKNLVTEALGTSFNINAFPNEDQMSIALEHGKVAIRSDQNDNSEIILQPGERILYNTNTKSIDKSLFSEKEVLSWTKGIIYFQNSTEDEVFKELEKWYGVKFQVNNATTKKWSYSGEFFNKSLENVLLSIGFTMDFEFSIDEKIVTIMYN